MTPPRLSLADIPPEYPHLRAALERYYAEHPEEALCADGATRALEAVLRMAAGAVQSEPSRVPAFMVRKFERAIEEAEHQKGMSTHDGKARVEASHLRLLLHVATHAAPVAAPAQQGETHPLIGNLAAGQSGRFSYAALPAGHAEPGAVPPDIQRDAERYRWLRTKDNSLEDRQRDKGIVYGLSCYHVVGGVRELKYDEELDAAIDAAIDASLRERQAGSCAKGRR